MIEVRKALYEDYNIIREIADRTWYTTYLSILSSEQLDYMLEMMYSPAAFSEQILIKNHHFLLASENGNILGFASYELNYYTETAKVHKLYVVPEAQGKGVGQKLLSVIEKEALKNNNDKIVLNVNRFNKAVNFYKKAGFEKAGEEDINIGNGYLMEDFIMKKELV
ncbi:GNAT family N-acetyltransferase [Flavobacterium sp. MFBS3-15]|uniref:GNAT family N-acetyltransferase n=1 Tax=Flavobacterium sp. MFBS3-15 TaxID=2989816 RepID=UPI00223637B1|nr:GNAT family N-acetyltransferase [Flavobacterium sp. MFBS3-15]MCW4470163.1 GNAT family N-acetyltransferase [Flavobacterium sp. MFBS3-15]